MSRLLFLKIFIYPKIEVFQVKLERKTLPLARELSFSYFAMLVGKDVNVFLKPEVPIPSVKVFIFYK
jgi:hypothetical protein